MRRDIGNEVIVAIAAIGVLAFALMFGIVLSLSNATPQSTVLEPTRTFSPAPTLEASFTWTATVTSVPSRTSLPTASDTPQPTSTTVPSDTPRPTRTRRPTATDTASPLPTEVPTDAPTEVVLLAPATEIPSATDTSAPSNTPIATFTDTATLTPVPPTATAIPATATNTATSVPPTLTFTSTFTATSIPPTATATRTPTSTPTATFTASAVPTATPTATIAIIVIVPTVDRSACLLPAGWTIYTAQASDTLYAIARSVGSSVEVLRAANCLEANDNISEGFDVYVPRPPVIPVETGVPFMPTGTALAAEGCTAPGVLIIAPAVGEELTGVFNLVGAAALPPSGFYRIDIRPNTTDTFTAYSRSNQSVVGGVLGVINSDLFDDGLHWIKLTVYDQNGKAAESCAIPVIFR